MLLNGKPIVSIVVATHNRPHFLHEFLESVEKQTYPHWEAVVVDDASTDNTSKVVEEFKIRNPNKVRYIYQDENTGFTQAAERGIREAEGELIMYMGDDDIIMPEMLQKGVAEFERNPELGLVYANLWQDKKIGGKQHLSSEYVGVRDKTLTPEEFLDLKMHRKAMCAQTSIFPKNIFEEIGGFKSEIQDTDLFFRVSTQYPICYIPEVLALNRKHEGNLVKEKFEEFARERIKYWEEKINTFDIAFQKKLKKYLMQIRLYHARIYLNEENFDYDLFRKHVFAMFRYSKVYHSWRPYAYLIIAILPKKVYLFLNHPKRVISK